MKGVLIMLQLIFDFFDKIVFSKLLTPEQDIMWLIVFDMLIARILFHTLRQKRKEFKGFRDYHDYSKHLVRNSRLMACFIIFSFIFTLRILFEFFAETPAIVYPHAAVVTLCAFYVNFKNYKLLAHPSI